MDPTDHIELHSQMYAFGTAVDNILGIAFNKTKSLFSLSNKDPLRLVARTPLGRATISRYIDYFYQSGGWCEKNIYLKGIFTNEGPKYVGGLTSLPDCRRGGNGN